MRQSTQCQTHPRTRGRPSLRKPPTRLKLRMPESLFPYRESSLVCTWVYFPQASLLHAALHQIRETPRRSRDLKWLIQRVLEIPPQTFRKGNQPKHQHSRNAMCYCYIFLHVQYCLVVPFPTFSRVKKFRGHRFDSVRECSCFPPL